MRGDRRRASVDPRGGSSAVQGGGGRDGEGRGGGGEEGGESEEDGDAAHVLAGAAAGEGGGQGEADGGGGAGEAWAFVAPCPRFLPPALEPSYALGRQPRASVPLPLAGRCGPDVPGEGNSVLIPWLPGFLAVALLYLSPAPGQAPPTRPAALHRGPKPRLKLWRRVACVTSSWIRASAPVSSHTALRKPQSLSMASRA